MNIDVLTETSETILKKHALTKTLVLNNGRIPQQFISNALEALKADIERKGSIPDTLIGALNNASWRHTRSHPLIVAAHISQAPDLGHYIMHEATKHIRKAIKQCDTANIDADILYITRRALSDTRHFCETGTKRDKHLSDAFVSQVAWVVLDAILNGQTSTPRGLLSIAYWTVCLTMDDMYGFLRLPQTTNSRAPSGLQRDYKLISIYGPRLDMALPSHDNKEGNILPNFNLKNVIENYYTR